MPNAVLPTTYAKLNVLVSEFMGINVVAASDVPPAVSTTLHIVVVEPSGRLAVSIFELLPPATSPRTISPVILLVAKSESLEVKSAILYVTVVPLP